MDYNTDTTPTSEPSAACLDAAQDWDTSMQAYASAVGGYIDGNTDVSYGDVVATGMQAFGDYVTMDTVCGEEI